jgi:predicted Ser/Thr protein kinase
VSDPAARDRWHRLRALVEGALELPAEQQQPWLDAQAGDDPAILEQARRLLAAHERGAALESPADAATALGDDHRLHAPGERVGSYVIDQEIARGGMGVVYRAWDTRLERWVALKALSPGLPAHAGARERLRREARAAGRLSHECIATVYALEEVGDELFIASEFVAGETLRARLARGRLPLGDCLAIAIAAARGLAAAHDLGIVHRDLKPENVLLTAEGRVKVVDFGIATMDGSGRGLTRTGVVLGTPGYMAPEQLSGQPVDARADVFALGVLIYEMVTGRSPFGDTGSWSVVAAVLEREPSPLSAVREDVPAALEAAVMTCLAKSPEARYPSAGAVAAALEPIVASLGTATPPVLATAERTRRSRAIWWLQFHQLAATIAIALMMVPAWKLMARIPRPAGRILVLVLLAMTATIATARLHLWFTAREGDGDLATEIDRIGPFVRWGNRAFALALGAGGVAVADAFTELAAVCLACAAGTLAVGEVVEPRTLARARRDRKGRP